MLMFSQGQEWAVEVPVWNKDNGVATRVGTKGEDSGYGSVGGRRGAVMAGAESPLDTCAIHEGEEGGDKMVRVGDGVDVDGVVVRGREVCKSNDGLSPSWSRREVEGAVDLGVGPSETSGDAKWRKGGREKRGEGGGDRGGGNVECRGVV